MTEALGSVRQTLQQIRTQIPNFGTLKIHFMSKLKEILYRVDGGKMVFYRLLFFVEISYFRMKNWSYFQENLIQF